MKRRDFVRIIGTTVGGMAIPLHLACGTRKPSSRLDDRWAPGIEVLTNSTCMLCPGACGITCRVVDGSLVGIRGNPYHPINKGGICPSGMAGLQLLYSPDRVRGPMVREGEKGDGRWREVGWDQGMALLKEKLVPLLERNEGGKVGFLSGVSSGTRADLIRAFMASLGAGEPYLDDRMDAYPHVLSLMHGIPRYPAFDLAGTDLVFSFGADLFGAWWCPLQAQTAYGERVGGVGGQRAEWVQIEHRLSRTGSQAQEWIPVRPGAYGALALGMAYVLIKEELYDHDFVSRRLAGYESWTDEGGVGHTGLRDMILQFYHPEAVSRLTGVD